MKKLYEIKDMQFIFSAFDPYGYEYMNLSRRLDLIDLEYYRFEGFDEEEKKETILYQDFVDIFFKISEENNNENFEKIMYLTAFEILGIDAENMSYNLQYVGNKFFSHQTLRTSPSFYNVIYNRIEECKKNFKISNYALNSKIFYYDDIFTLLYGFIENPYEKLKDCVKKENQELWYLYNKTRNNYLIDEIEKLEKEFQKLKNEVLKYKKRKRDNKTIYIKEE